MATSKQTKTVDGIEVTINPAVLTDWDLIAELSEAMDQEEGQDPNDVELAMKRVKLVEHVLSTIFGEEQLKRIKDEIRKRNDGVLPADKLMGFLSDTFGAFQLKN